MYPAVTSALILRMDARRHSTELRLRKISCRFAADLSMPTQGEAHGLPSDAFLDEVALGATCQAHAEAWKCRIQVEHLAGGRKPEPRDGVFVNLSFGTVFARVFLGRPRGGRLLRGGAI